MGLIESNSSWIIALGKTVLNSLWIGLLALSLLKALFLVIPQRFSTVRYHASLLSLFVFTALITALFLHIYSPAEAVQETLSSGIHIQVAPNTGVADGSMVGSQLYRGISLVYFAGMGIYLLVTLLGIGRIRALRQGADSITGRWYQLFCELRYEAGICRKVEFLVSDQVSGPFLTGVLKPAIIVPSAMLTQLSFREIEAILMHELYHLKQLDHVMNLLQRLVEILFFFNPAVWILSRIIRSEREKRCDDLVIAGNTQAVDYARALYVLSMQMNASGLRAIAATGNGKGELRKRIERILKPNAMKTNYREKINTLLLFTCGILVVFLISGFTSGFSITLHNDEPAEYQPYTESLALQESIAPPAFPENTENPDVLIPAPMAPQSSAPDTLSEQEMERIRKEVRDAIEEARAEVDWDEIMEDIEEARNAAMEEIDWEQIKEDIEEARNAAMEEINWDEMKIEMADLRIQIDSMLGDFDFDLDEDFDHDVDVDDDSKR